MNKLDLNDVVQYVEDNISTFHERRLASLDSLKLGDVLRRKNPYMFKAKNVLTSEEIVKGIVDAHISSNEEAVFGNWLEGLAIHINAAVYGGRKSATAGIDLEFDRDGTRYLVSIKSGPNWGNSGQIKNMVSSFKTAQKTLRTSDSGVHVVCVNGCCYGRDRNPDKGDYMKYCGQDFWEFISGNEELYTEIIEPLGHRAQEHNDEYAEAYARRINLLTLEFGQQFCDSNGEIDWEKLVEFNSGKESS